MLIIILHSIRFKQILWIYIVSYLAHRETIQLTFDKICGNSSHLITVWLLSFDLGSNNEFSSCTKHRPWLELRWNGPEDRLSWYWYFYLILCVASYAVTIAYIILWYLIYSYIVTRNISNSNINIIINYIRLPNDRTLNFMFYTTAENWSQIAYLSRFHPSVYLSLFHSPSTSISYILKRSTYYPWALGVRGGFRWAQRSENREGCR